MSTILFILLYSIVASILSAVLGLFDVSVVPIAVIAITLFISISISKKIENINLDEKSPALFFSFGSFIIAFNIFIFLRSIDNEHQLVYFIELAWIVIAFLLSILRKYVFKSEISVYRSMISYYANFIILFMLLYFDKFIVIPKFFFEFFGVLAVGLFWHFIDVFLGIIQKRR